MVTAGLSQAHSGISHQQGSSSTQVRSMSEPQPFWEVAPGGFRDVVETKVVGCFPMARALVPLMLRAGRRPGRQHLDERADDGPPWLRATTGPREQASRRCRG